MRLQLKHLFHKTYLLAALNCFAISGTSNHSRLNIAQPEQTDVKDSLQAPRQSACQYSVSYVQSLAFNAKYAVNNFYELIKSGTFLGPSNLPLRKVLDLETRLNNTLSEIKENPNCADQVAVVHETLVWWSSKHLQNLKRFDNRKKHHHRVDDILWYEGDSVTDQQLD